MSLEGQAESYNDLWWDSKKVEIIRRFLDKNQSVGKHFDKKIVDIDVDEIQLPFDDDWEGKESGKGVFTGMHELHRKNLSQVIILIQYFCSMMFIQRLSSLFGFMKN